ncbi:thioredoxin-related transmembrane protein 2-A-like [Hydractinia symbiolongicarpus]|uniref:thioredoxin-related transmembrane protein 2-A-like n=1 Tax=Hydractinia symbiolongicarpus TaxID=13093 RepID=UPI00254BE05F|nr:thioredoxin-related transmembrane protein 2-A-like [Hydractinia symbiolongicarpus]
MEAITSYLSTHYFLNMLACILFLITRCNYFLCTMLFELSEEGECQLDWRDTEILMFLCLVLVIKNRRWKPISNREYIANTFLFGKCANALLFSRQDLRLGFLYIAFCLFLFVVFPEPSYSGPDNVTFFRGQALDEVLHHEPEKCLFVEFYATWSPPCSRFSSTFASLSLQYGNEFFKFGKLDVTRYQMIADKYKVNSDISSKNLPTLILFKNGKESLRRPTLNSKGVVSPYIFKEQNIIQDFNLNEVYAETKKKEKIQNGKKKN